MTETPQPQHPQYRPGDVVNGHMLGNDGHWYPLGSWPMPPAQHAQQPQETQPREKASYGEKFKRRWKICWLVMTAITVLVLIPKLTDEGPIPWVIDALLAGGLTGLLYGTVVCLIAALFPGEKRVT